MCGCHPSKRQDSLGKGGDCEVVEKSKGCKTASRTYDEDEKSTWEDWLIPGSMENV